MAKSETGKRPVSKYVSGAEAEKQVRLFIAKFDPAVAKLIRELRAGLRKHLPTAIEQVYDNYNFFVIGYSSTDRTSDCICSLAAAANGVSLSFYLGASLPDPNGILLGDGKQNRFVRLPSVKTLAEPLVAALIVAASAQAKTPLPKTGGGYTLVKSISKKQRPRRKVD